MSLEQLTPVFLFLAITGMVLAGWAMTGRTRARVAVRIESLAAEKSEMVVGTFQLAAQADTKGKDPLVAGKAARGDRLRQRLLHAGYYHPDAERTFKNVQFTLLIVPWLMALIAFLAGFVSTKYGAAGAGALSAVALVGPGIWLDKRKGARHRQFKKALPDFFDMLVMCLESGLALPSAWRKVGREMNEAYPLLHSELAVADGEMELGGSMGEAIRRCAGRTALEELHSLASVVGQAERLGTGLAKPMRVLADTLRLQRVQRAEELAHKSATKIMFPTLLFIFPGVFAIILGPMAIQVMNLFGGAK